MSESTPWLDPPDKVRGDPMPAPPLRATDGCRQSPDRLRRMRPRELNSPRFPVQEPPISADATSSALLRPGTAWACLEIVCSVPSAPGWLKEMSGSLRQESGFW